MQYTIILRRSNFLCELFDDDASEFYVSNPDTEFGSVKSAIEAAKKEAARADTKDIRHVMSERGIRNAQAVTGDPDNYEMLFVFEGRHEVKKFGWQL